MTAPPRICACGHDEEAHEHWRAGTECALCGPDLCVGFRVPDGPPPVSPELRRLLAVVIGVPLAIVLVATVGASLGEGAPVAVAVLVALIGGAAVWYLVRR